MLRWTLHLSPRPTRYISTPLFTHRITIKYPEYGGKNTILALSMCDGTGASRKAHHATIHNAIMIWVSRREDSALGPG
jgi:hypothetical protein